MAHLFVYGSLQFSELIEKLTGKKLKTAQAFLSNYKRVRVRDCDYPAIFYDEKSKVEGKLYFDVDNKSMQILGFFEGEDYKKERVKVLSENVEIAALVFVWNKALDLLEMKEWERSQFKKNSLDFYMNEIIPATIEEFKKIN